MHEVYESADTCEEAAHEVREELRKSNVDTEHVGALVVTAYCVEASSDLGPAKEHEEEDDYEKRYDDADLYIRGDICAGLIYRAHSGYRDPCPLESLELLVFDIELRRVNYGGHAFGKEHSGQRYYERLDLEVSDQESLNEAERESDAQSDQESRKYIAVMVIKMYGA